MFAKSEAKMTSASTEPATIPSSRSGFPPSSTAAESTTSAEGPAGSYATDIRSITASFNDSPTKYQQNKCSATSSGPESPPHTASQTKATASKYNVGFTPAISKASCVKQDTSTIDPATLNNSTKDSTTFNIAVYSVACSYCGKEGHSQDVCRKQKREVGCLNCGVKSHLEHQCGKTSGNQCLYCLRKGHSEDTCFHLKRDMTLCFYCSKFGHAEHQCLKKRRDLGFETHFASIAPDYRDNLHSISSSHRSSNFNSQSTEFSGRNGSCWNPFMRNPTVGNMDAIHEHRHPVAQVGKIEKDIQDTLAQMGLRSERPQVPPATARALTNKYIFTPTNKVKPIRLEDKTVQRIFHQGPVNEFRAAHSQDGHASHRGSCMQDNMPASSTLDSVVAEPSECIDSIMNSQRGLNALVTNISPKTSTNRRSTVYALQDAARTRRAQKPATTVDYEFMEFQRRLMMERREEAMRLRRAQNRVHC
ncbi:hypothetical protein VM1G_09740 [Cytospora mali]|uniref:CCHC-type domain-containing protein n=1 Tax=Cytospora mali TaxID=578113 RepID=A0A194WDG0_CYTMA|nr:hypothetical protein VM1G_09740 [Valsa mali]